MLYYCRLRWAVQKLVDKTKIHSAASKKLLESNRINHESTIHDCVKRLDHRIGFHDETAPAHGKKGKGWIYATYQGRCYSPHHSKTSQIPHRVREPKPKEAHSMLWGQTWHTHPWEGFLEYMGGSSKWAEKRWWPPKTKNHHWWLPFSLTCCSLV